MEKVLTLVELLAKPLLVLVVVLLVLLFVVRPLVKLLGARPPKGPARPAPLSEKQFNALAAELEASMGKRKPTLSDQEKITRLAQSDPDRARDLVRRWLRQ